MRVPTRSAGTRSGVNWMRLKLPRIVRASVFTVSVLARPGHAFDQQVSLREDRHQHALEKVVLADDDPLHLVEDALHQRSDVVAVWLPCRSCVPALVVR